MKRRFTATRHASYTSAIDGDETYCLIFTHVEDDPHIEVKFKNGWPHDSINVLDHSTNTTRVHSWEEFRQEVADYMATQTRDSFRLNWVNAS